MDGPSSPSPLWSSSRSPLGRLRTIAVAAAGTLALASVAPAQDVAKRPDQVFRQRADKVTTVTGIVTENSLTSVRVDRAGKESTYDASEIVRIVWGKVPPAFRDGTTYAQRGDYENAVARFRVAAGDAAGREVVRAEARLRAAEALLAWGAEDVNRYTEAIAEVDRFLTDYPSNRAVPRGQWTKARATLLSSDAAGAAAAFRALYEHGANEPATAGYDRATCLEAGLAAARAFLVTGDTGTARELYVALEVAFGQAAAAVEDMSSPVRARLLNGQGEASVGEGFCLLAGGQAKQAQTFFEGRVTRTDISSGARFAATLGLAEALAESGRLRQAQIEFARVSALDHTDRDRVARALVGLADVSVKLADSDSVANAKLWLTKVRENYGDTPAASSAAELLKNL